MFEFGRKIVPAMAIFIGATIGAGLFGIPYVISKSGLIPGLFYFLIFGLAMVFIHLFFGEIILSTKGNHRLPSLAKKYLGRKEEKIVFASIILASVGSLLAYIIIGGDFLRLLFSSDSAMNFNILFWVVGAYFIFRGVKLIAPAEVVTNIFFFLIIIIIFFFSAPEVSLSNFTLLNSQSIFLPYGIILFSLMGLNAIPETIEFLKGCNEQKSFKKIVVASFLIIIFFYLAFAFFTIGVSGSNTSPDVFGGLAPFLGNKVIFLGALAAVVTLLDSFIVLGMHLKNVLIYDYRVNKILASTIVCTAPMVLFLIGFRNFISITSVVGTIVVTIQGIIIVLIFKEIKGQRDKEPEFSLKVPLVALYLLILMFILGGISQFI